MKFGTPVYIFALQPQPFQFVVITDTAIWAYTPEKSSNTAIDNSIDRQITVFDTEMSILERNKAIVTKYFEEYWAKGNVSIVDEMCSDDFLISYPNHGPRRGKDEAKKMLSEFMEVRPSYPSQLLLPCPICDIDLGIPRPNFPSLRATFDRRRRLRCG
jgi:hypothetical protein